MVSLVLFFRHFTCDCPPEWSGSHCENPVAAESESIVATLTSTKNVGRIVGFVILATFVGLLLCWLSDRRIARKKKERQRKRRLMGMTDKSYARRRGQERKDRQPTQPTTEGEMA
jgi:hypothetical protein